MNNKRMEIARRHTAIIFQHFMEYYFFYSQNSRKTTVKEENPLFLLCSQSLETNFIYSKVGLLLYKEKY